MSKFVQYWLRGGSWLNARVYARAVYRFGYGPDVRGYGVGFRVVRGGGK